MAQGNGLFYCDKCLTRYKYLADVAQMLLDRKLSVVRQQGAPFVNTLAGYDMPPLF